MVIRKGFGEVIGLAEKHKYLLLHFGNALTPREILVSAWQAEDVLEEGAFLRARHLVAAAARSGCGGLS